MTLKECCELGDACGLQTLEEAYFNVEFHALNLFVYTKMVKELNELYEEYKKYPSNTKISDYLLDKKENM